MISESAMNDVLVWRLVGHGCSCSLSGSSSLAALARAVADQPPALMFYRGFTYRGRRPF